MSQAVSDLLNEHEAIASALQILERMNAKIEEKKAVFAPDMAEFITFLKEFADNCHHGKEEIFLFPAVLAADPKTGGMIGVLLKEHTMGRQLIEEMTKSIEGDANLERLLNATRGYILLMRNHVQKENGVLFPMTEDVLSKEELEELFEGFETHEENVIGHGRHEELHAILEDLEHKYSL